MYACKDIFISNAVWLLLLLCLYTMKINIYKEQEQTTKNIVGNTTLPWFP